MSDLRARLAALNDAATIKEIIRRYWWAEAAELSRAEYERFLERLQLKRLPGLTKYQEPCPRCGQVSWSMYGPRNGKLQCSVCRQFFFPKAGSPAAAKALDRLAKVTPRNFAVQCAYPCRYRANGYCDHRGGLTIGQNGLCLQRTEETKWTSDTKC